MKTCKNCNCELSDSDIFCPKCGTKAEEEEKNALHKIKSLSVKLFPLIKEHKKTVISCIAGILVLIAVIVAYNETHCDVSACNNTVVSGSNYCSNHKCSYSSCTSRRASSYNTNYCYYHYTLAESLYSQNAEYDLKISNIKLSENSSYTKVTGTITNYGTTSYGYVKVKGSFETSYGTVVDTDWTYAVGSEGLSPGESKSFSMSVPKNYSIDNCEITIIDYD